MRTSNHGIDPDPAPRQPRARAAGEPRARRSCVLRPSTGVRRLAGGFRRAAVALVVAASLLPAPVRALEPAPQSPEEAARFEEARQLYADDHHLAAAAAFEGLHRDTGNPLYLYYAGLARENAGHDAHAVLHWQQALRAGLDETFTGKAQTRLDQAKARTTAFAISVTPVALAEGATLELRYRGAGNREPLVIAPADLPLYLEAGDWTATLVAKHPAFEKLALPFTVARGTPHFEQHFALPPIEHAVTFEIGPREALAAGVALTLRDTEGLAAERPAETLRSARHTVPLRAGTWDYTASAPGYGARSGSLTSAPGALPIAISLQSTAARPVGNPGAALSPRARRRLALGLGLGALAPAIAGGVLTGMAARDETTTRMYEKWPESYLAQVHDRYLGGLVLIGAAGGTWVGTAMTFAPLRKGAWHATLGVGGALGVGGLAWNLVTYSTTRSAYFNDGKAPPPHDMCETCGSVTRDEWKSNKIAVVGSSFLIGLGAGLVVAAVSNLLAARARPQKVALQPAANGLRLRF